LKRGCKAAPLTRPGGAALYHPAAPARAKFARQRKKRNVASGLNREKPRNSLSRMAAENQEQTRPS